ncbi:glycosyltransferase family 4 protein [Lutimonas halocynthiae]|uniref:glycosyltransferase family 4 protein n=1 Tax=Lutimonas halocynthiae TaxID=1446477 RepID=UPI0025B5C926|nr:glycosyltransferase family 4 protein [Lutimonas halocynthiae]MDN3641067.1 glycosyltransferase family 4 protein [Lutimonas halocynthiae]
MKKKLKILFLTDNFPPELNAPATRTYEHCKSWVSKDVDVTVITCAPNFPVGKVYEGYKNGLYKIEYIDGIRVIRVWTYITKNSGVYKRTIDYISFAFSSFIAGFFIKSDLIIATSPQFFTALSGRALGYWRKTPWVMEVRDLWPESIKTVGAMKDSLIIKYFERQELKCYHKASQIITVTHSFKEEIINKGIDENKISVITNGANRNLFKPLDKNTSLLEELNLKDKFIIGFTGTHGMAHKLDFILNCASKINDPDIHFLFIGDGSEKNSLIKLANELKINNVTFLDMMSKKELKEYLSILDVALVNLKKDALFKTVIPSKIFENAAMNIPILLGVDGEAREIIEKHNAGLYFEPENEEDFMNKIDFMKNDSDILTKFKMGGNQLALEYDRARLADQMLKILRTNKCPS